MRFPGASWWKVDIHTHTPASTDFGKMSPDCGELRATTPSTWLLAFMRAGIDAVVVTDHNSGVWIDQLKTALAELERDGAEGGHPPTIFPGVEITANGGAHVLAILPLDATTATVDALLGAVHYRGARGASDVAADASPIDVVNAIVAAGGIPILAHVDAADNSAFTTRGNTLGPLLDAAGLHAIEVCNPTSWTPPEICRQHRPLAYVLGSDSHHLSGGAGQRYPGSHFTWVKMEAPSLDALRLALLDGDDVSIRRSDLAPDDQNRFSHAIIESVRITEARYCGRATPPGSDPFEAPMSPWLTTIIGGRGTGKSTIVELMRLALRREDELPEALRADFETFRHVPRNRADRGALTDATEVAIVFRKDEHRYRIRWSQAGSVPAIEEFQAGTWVASAGEVRGRFPVRIFSQRQIFELARDSRALLKIVSEAAEVDLHGWSSRWQIETGRFLALRAKQRELEKRVAERSSLDGALVDVTRKLAVFEEAEHAHVLKDYQRAQRQRRGLENWESNLQEIEAALREVAGRVAPLDLDDAMFDASNPTEQAVLASVTSHGAWLGEVARQLMGLAESERQRHAAWTQQLATSEWSREIDRITARYDKLVAELGARGVTDVGQYGTLVQQRRLLEEKLRGLDALRVTIDQLRQETATVLATLATLRAKLTSRRHRFVNDVLRDNPHVRMTVSAYGDDPRTAEAEFRKALDRADGKLIDDILSDDGTRGRLADLYRGLPVERESRALELERRIAALKLELEELSRDESRRGWFEKHLQQLSPEIVDRLQLWFPADELTVTYCPSGDGRTFRPLDQASPGQKTAAILAFLLTYGTEPLVLDQPEDDLDNQLIYDLIVSQLRANKRRRQVIVVTHNPNIVVNGDSELILIMDSRGGQSRLAHQGSLQSREVRAQVCAVMEGGREALEKRYRRIMGGARDV